MSPFKVPHPDESLHIFGVNTKRVLGDEKISVLVWNVYKGKRGKTFFQDFIKLTETSDFILLQEAMIDETMPELWKTHRDLHHWKMAASFEYLHDRSRTGVITGSLVQSDKYRLIRSVEREFFFWTPKVSLCSYYHIEGSAEKLLVINTHVVNFVTTAGFRVFIMELVKVIQEHQGPILFGGDFNTWNPWRWEALLEVLAEFNLEHLVFQRDPRLLKLDHVFLRGFAVHSAEIKQEIQSSDHYPLEILLRLKG
ncbi:MAG: endonuclease/exonuclease/phosphatase family protein [Bdellovibrionaceae bacterium]|nr:endonuclease/exonuclease/phosphatase family protein [Pseudobdellovibrionaceae bacterium]